MALNAELRNMFQLRNGTNESAFCETIAKAIQDFHPRTDF